GVAAGDRAVRGALRERLRLSVQPLARTGETLLHAPGRPRDRPLRRGCDLGGLLLHDLGRVLGDAGRRLLRLGRAPLDLRVLGDAMRGALEGLVRAAARARTDHEADRESCQENELLHRVLLSARVWGDRVTVRRARRAPRPPT